MKTKTKQHIGNVLMVLTSALIFLYGFLSSLYLRIPLLFITLAVTLPARQVEVKYFNGCGIGVDLGHGLPGYAYLQVRDYGTMATRDIWVNNSTHGLLYVESSPTGSVEYYSQYSGWLNAVVPAGHYLQIVVNANNQAFLTNVVPYDQTGSMPSPEDMGEVFIRGLILGVLVASTTVMISLLRKAGQSSLT